VRKKGDLNENCALVINNGLMVKTNNHRIGALLYNVCAHTLLRVLLYIASRVYRRQHARKF